MSEGITNADTFKPKLSNDDHDHLKALGAPAAVCGKKPGGKSVGSTHRNRAGWNVYASIEGRGRELCEACLKAAESIAPKEQQ